jgi:hypothetical protein
VLSIKLIYLELLISHFIRPVESAEIPNVARASRSLETPGVDDSRGGGFVWRRSAQACVAARC